MGKLWYEVCWLFRWGWSCGGVHVGEILVEETWQHHETLEVRRVRRELF